MTLRREEAVDSPPEPARRALVAAVGAERVSFEPAYRDEVAADATRLWRVFAGRRPGPERPWAVVRPETTEQVASAVSVAHEHRVPVVPYGGGSGLVGGAVSVRPGIVIDLRSMDRIVSVSAEDRSAHVEAGAVLKHVNASLEAQGFMLGHDPWSLPVATVGGAISTDGLGYMAGRYGSMGDQVLGLTAVLPDGRTLRMRALPKHSVGIDLNRLFIGAEGTLGIVTEATLRIFPKPERRVLCAVAFPSFQAGFQAVLDMLRCGMRSAVADFGERFDPPEELRGARPSPHEGVTVLYLVFDGYEEEVAAQERRALAICRTNGGEELDESEAREFWEHRHDSGERFLQTRQAGRVPAWQAPSNVTYEYLNMVVPASRVLEYRRRCHDIARRNEVHLLEAGFWALPELFAVVLVKVGRDEQDARGVMRRVADELLTLAQDMGGALEQCHGVGLRWAHLMEQQHGTGLEVMRQIKRALDPHNIMNPGKLALDGD